MSDLKPWDAGYVPPAPMTSQEINERRREVGRMGGKAGGRAKVKRREKGVQVSFKGKVKRKPDPNSETSKRLARYTEDNMREDVKGFAERFVTEYLRDFNAPMAYIRAGRSAGHASTGGPETLRWPYVQQLLADTVDAMKEENLLTRKMVLMGLLKEANHMGDDTSHGARVRSWMGLARIMKMDVQVTENHHMHQGGVMLIPANDQANTIEGWGLITEMEQAKLKEDVRK